MNRRRGEPRVSSRSRGRRPVKNYQAKTKKSLNKQDLNKTSSSMSPLLDSAYKMNVEKKNEIATINSGPQLNLERNDDVSSMSEVQVTGKRTRIKPVKFWTNESRILYKYLPNGCREIDKSNVGVVRQLFSDTPSERKKITNKHMKKDAQKPSTSKIDGVSALSITNIGENLENVEQNYNPEITPDHSKNKTFKEPASGGIDIIESVLISSALFSTNDNDLIYNSLGSNVSAAIKLKTEKLICLKMIFSHGGKQADCANKNLIFTVNKGSVRVTIHNVTKICDESDIFFIPLGINYNIENEADEDALLNCFIY